MQALMAVLDFIIIILLGSICFEVLKIRKKLDSCGDGLKAQGPPESGG